MAQDRSRVAVAATAAVVVVGYLARTIAKLLEENSELKLRLANESTGDKPAEIAINSKHCLKEEVNKMMRNRMYRALEMALEREDHVMEIAKVPYIDFDAEKECSL